MKSILLTLCCALVVSVSFGQLPASHINKAKPIPFVNVPTKPATAGAARGISTFEVSYHDMDINYSTANNYDFGYFGWELNKNFDVSCNPLDTLDDNTVSWAAVVFDSIHDYVNDVSYQKATFNSMTVDTIYFLYSHENTSGLNDTLIVSLYATAPSPSGLAFTNATQKEFSNTLLWSDTTITDSSLTPNAGTSLFFGAVIPGGITIPAGQGFVIRMDYSGPKEDIFNLADLNRLECAASGAASESIVPGNTFRYYNGGNYTPAPCSDLSGVGGLVFPSLPAECNQFYFQNFAISAVVTVDAPLAVAASASENVGCPGEFVSLTANASGGSGSNNYSYVWSGNGNFTTPNSPTTTVELPQGNQVQTYTVEVIDAVENTTVTSSVNVTVRGISVSLGNDTTISCTDSILVAAQTTGFLNGTTFAWSDGGTTQQQYVTGGATYTITVTNNAGCTGIDSKVVNLDVNQNVSFTSTTIYTPGDTVPLSQNRACLGSTVFFQNTSTDVSNAWSFEWDYGNQTGSINTNGVKTYDATGVFTVTLTASNASGCVITSAPLSIQILPENHPVCEDLGSSIAEIELLSNINLYPNPNSGSFVVDLSKVNASMANVAVVDMLGKVVYNSNTFSTNANPIHSIDINNASNGIYFVRITADGVTVTSKISVAK